MQRKKIAIDIDKTILDIRLKFTPSYFLSQRKMPKEKLNRFARYRKFYVSRNLGDFNKAVDALKKIHSAGAEVYFLTDRSNYRAFSETTISALSDYGINFIGSVIECGSKAEIAKELGATLFVSQQSSFVKQAKNLGMKSFLMFSDREKVSASKNEWGKVADFVIENMNAEEAEK